MSNDLETIQELPVQDASIVSQLATAEINALVSTARAYPRSIKNARHTMTELATLDEQAAQECMYALPRGGKSIEGPSIRLAELVAQSWGNCRVAARTTHIDRTEKFVEAEGVFLDAQTNTATMARVRRRIVDSKGRVYNDDMILTTCNAAQSIARRNAILSGVPRAVWRQAYDASRNVVMGDIKTLANRRSEALTAFGRFGLTAAQVFKIMGVEDADGIGLEKLVTLRGTYSALLNSETTVEELLRSIEPAKADRVGPSATPAAAPAAFDNSLPSADGAAKAPAAPASAPAATVAPTPAPAAPTAPQAAAANATATPAADPAPAEVETVPEDLLDFVGDMQDVTTAAELDVTWKRWKRVYNGQHVPAQKFMLNIYTRTDSRVKAKSPNRAVAQSAA